MTAVTDEDTMILGDGGIEPQAVAHHVGVRNLSDALCCADIHVAADYHRMEARRSLLHDALIERQLQVEQRLRQALAALPAEHGDRCQYLAADGVGWQTAALTASMQHDALLGSQPSLKFFVFVFVPVNVPVTKESLHQQPRRSPTRP